MTVIERPRCDCCEQPIHGESYPSQDHEATICARCCVELLGGQVERLDRQLAGAVADAYGKGVEDAREQIKALITAQSAAGYVETAGWALLLDEIAKLPTPGGQ